MLILCLHDCILQKIISHLYHDDELLAMGASKSGHLLAHLCDVLNLQEILYARKGPP